MKLLLQITGLALIRWKTKPFNGFAWNCFRNGPLDRGENKSQAKWGLWNHKLGDN